MRSSRRAAAKECSQNQSLDKAEFYSRRGASGGEVATTGPQETPTARVTPGAERTSLQGGGRRAEFQDTNDHAVASSSSQEAFQRTQPSSVIFPTPASWVSDARVSNTAPNPTPAKVRQISRIWQNSSMSNEQQKNQFQSSTSQHSSKTTQITRCFGGWSLLTHSVQNAYYSHVRLGHRW
jgi:hypothetical protein